MNAHSISEKVPSQREYELALLAEYHGQIMCTLQGDIGEGRPGYRAELNEALYARQGTRDWEAAYIEAHAYHQRRWEALCTELGNFAPNANQVSGVLDAGIQHWVRLNQRFEMEFYDWVSNRISLGTEPEFQLWRKNESVKKSVTDLCSCPKLDVLQTGCKCGGV